MNNHENCQVEPLQKRFDPKALAHADSALLAVSGMGCPRCAVRVRNELLRLNGVLLADVDLDQATALAAFDPDLIAATDLIMAVAAAGNDGRHRYRAQVVSQAPAAEALRMWPIPLQR